MPAEPVDSTRLHADLFERAPTALWEVDLSALVPWMRSLREQGVVDLAPWLEAHPDALREAVATVSLRTANRAALLMSGTSDADAMRGPLNRLVGGGSLEAFGTLVAEAFRGRRWIELETSARTVEGTDFDVQATVALPEDTDAWDSVVIGLVDISRRKRHERILDEIARGVSTVTGETFLRSTVTAFARALGADHAFVGELVEGKHNRIRTLALFSDGEIRDDFEYGLEGTPCSGVVGHSQCLIRAGVQEQYPDDDLLVEMGAAGYAGVPLRDSSGASIGLMAVLFRQPIAEPDLVQSAMAIFAARAAAELERLQGERQREALQQSLSQAQKMESIGRLAGGIAHDFNNLLTPIIGLTQLASTRVQGDRELLSDLKQIMIAAERAAELTRQLLAFGRRQILTLQRLDVNEVISGLTPMLDRVIREDIELTTQLAAPAHGVRADRSQLEQVIMNLSVNAQDAMPEGGVLTIRTAMHVVHDEGEGLRPGTYLSLSVLDTGTGISPDILVHIFEPFFTTKSVDEGTGLGLATVFGVATQHGGTVRVQSSAGRGSAFEVLLPVEGEVADATASIDDTEEAPGGSGRILIVEDDEAVRALTCRMLLALGYQVVSASSSDHALTLAQRLGSNLNMLVTDVVMPGLTGPQLVSRIRELGVDCPVLYMSGYAQDGLIEQVRSADRVDLLEKPFSMNQLAQSVKRALES